MGGCGTKPPNPDQIDLSHFQVLRVVGKGGFGKVNVVTVREESGAVKEKGFLALKRLSKAIVLKSKSHLANVWIERDVMSKVHSPFLCTLNYAFQSKTELFLVMPFMQGGDLRYHLNHTGVMNCPTAAFYAAQLALGLEHLHSKRIVFRDLKPENLLLDSDGNMRVSDFGLACILKGPDYTTRGQSGTPGYQAPEVIQNLHYGTDVDIWSYGVTVYEFMHGRRPFSHAHAPASSVFQSGIGINDIHVNSSSGSLWTTMDQFKLPLTFAKGLQPEAIQFLSALLCVDYKKRLRNWDQIKAHPFFAVNKIDFSKIESRTAPCPIHPDCEGNKANCENIADAEDALLDLPPEPIPDSEQVKFLEWDWNTSISKPQSNIEKEKDKDKDKGRDYQVSNQASTITNNSNSASDEQPNNINTNANVQNDKVSDKIENDNNDTTNEEKEKEQNPTNPAGATTATGTGTIQKGAKMPRISESQSIANPSTN